MSNVCLIGRGRALQKARALALENGLNPSEIELSENVEVNELYELVMKLNDTPAHLAIDPHHLCLERGTVLKILMTRRLKLISLISRNSRIHPSANIGRNVLIGSDTTISSGAKVSDGVYVGGGCVLHADSTLGRDAWVGDSVTIGVGAAVGAGTCIANGAQISAGSKIGARCELSIPQLYSGVMPDYSHHIAAARKPIRFVSNSGLRESSNA